jgi:hypothetical protein
MVMAILKKEDVEIVKGRMLGYGVTKEVPNIWRWLAGDGAFCFQVSHE